MRRRNNAIVPCTAESCNAQMKPVLRRIAKLLVNGGVPEKFIEAYRKIPADKSMLRKEFLCRIQRKARQENWSAQKLGNIMSVIG